MSPGSSWPDGTVVVWPEVWTCESRGAGRGCLSNGRQDRGDPCGACTKAPSVHCACSLWVCVRGGSVSERGLVWMTPVTLESYVAGGPSQTGERFWCGRHWTSCAQCSWGSMVRAYGALPINRWRKTNTNQSENVNHKPCSAYSISFGLNDATTGIKIGETAHSGGVRFGSHA